VDSMGKGKKHVLIVDDEALIARQIADFLIHRGYAATCLGSGEETVRLMREGFVPDLILMDIDLGRGRMDGTETASRIYDGIGDVPVVFHTCHSDEATIAKTKAVSKYGIVDKVPGNEMFLLATIDTALSLHEANRKLHESEERYRTLAEAAHDVIFIVDRREQLEYINPYGAVQIGRRPEELVGCRVSELFPPATYKRLHVHFRKVFKTGESVYQENPIQFPDREMWLGTRLVPLKRSGGMPFAVMGIARDISIPKRVEYTPMQSQQILHQTFSNLNDAVFIVDVNFSKLLDCNPATCRLFGSEREELIGRPFAFLHERPCSVNELKPLRRPRGRKDGTAFYPDCRMRRVDGTVFPAEFAISPLCDDRKRVLGWMGVVHDVTARNKTESALRESEERFRSLFENATIGIYRTTPDGRILLANPTLIHMLGFASMEDLTKRNLEKNGFETDYPRERFRERIEKAEEVRGVESAWKRSDGKTLFIRESARAVRGSDGSVLYYEGTVEDISEKRHAEEQMRKALDEKDLLLRELQHRMKNNMAVISSLLSLEMRRLKDPDALRAFSEARNRIRSMTRVYDTLSKSDDLKHIDFHTTIQNLAQELFKNYNTHAGRIRLSIAVNDVTIDFKKAIPCGLILNELISNALKYAFPEGRSGTVSIVLKPAGRGLARLTVSDDGIGFPGPFKPKLLKTMGLRLVMMLAEQIEGRLQLTVRKGTTFRLDFPI